MLEDITKRNEELERQARGNLSPRSSMDRAVEKQDESSMMQVQIGQLTQQVTTLQAQLQEVEQKLIDREAQIEDFMKPDGEDKTKVLLLQLEDSKALAAELEKRISQTLHEREDSIKQLQTLELELDNEKHRTKGKLLSSLLILLEWTEKLALEQDNTKAKQRQIEELNIRINELNQAIFQKSIQHTNLEEQLKQEQNANREAAVGKEKQNSANLQKEIEELHEQCNELHEVAVKAREEKVAMMQDLDSAKEYQSQLELRLEETQKSATTLKQECEAWQKNCNQLEQRLNYQANEIAELQNSTQEQERSLQQTRVELLATLTALQEEKDMHRRIQQTLQLSVDKERQQHDKTKEELTQQFQQELNLHITQIKELQDKIEQEQLNFNQSKAELQSTVESHQRIQQSWQQSIEDGKNAHLSALEHSIEEANTALANEKQIFEKQLLLRDTKIMELQDKMAEKLQQEARNILDNAHVTFEQALLEENAKASQVVEKERSVLHDAQKELTKTVQASQLQVQSLQRNLEELQKKLEAEVRAHQQTKQESTMTYELLSSEKQTVSGQVQASCATH